MYPRANQFPQSISLTAKKRSTQEMVTPAIFFHTKIPGSFPIPITLFELWECVFPSSSHNSLWKVTHLKNSMKWDVSISRDYWIYLTWKNFEELRILRKSSKNRDFLFEQFAILRQVNRFQKIILVIVQYKFLKSCSGDFILQNLLLRKRLCSTVFISESSWVFHFRQINMIGRKCFVPQLYHFRRSISGRLALEYLYKIHKDLSSPTVVVHVILTQR